MQNNPEKNARDITIPDHKLYYRTIIIIILKKQYTTGKRKIIH